MRYLTTAQSEEL